MSQPRSPAPILTAAQAEPLPELSQILDGMVSLDPLTHLIGRLAMARIRDVVFDCRHPASVARFWAGALEGYAVAPYDEAELDRLRAAGIDDPEDDPTVLVEPLPGGTPRLWFQLVPESKVAKNRVHLDLTCADVRAEVARLAGLGARVLDEQEHWVTMADPEGNEFDVMAG